MKPWYQSKTIWFNIVTTLVAIIGQVTNAIPFSENAMKIFGTILAVGNIALRYLSTSTALK